MVTLGTLDGLIDYSEEECTQMKGLCHKHFISLHNYTFVSELKFNNKLVFLIRGTHS